MPDQPVSGEVTTGLDADPRIRRIGKTADGRAVVRLDWRAYFKEFCEQHGTWPVVHGGRLLFRDGWTHSSTDHAGPEWPPPDDPEELRKLLLAYWRRRLEIVKPLRDDLRATLADLERQQALRPTAALQQRNVWWDQEQGKFAGASEGVDWNGLRGRLDWLEQDVKECEGKVTELTASAQVQNDERQTTSDLA